MRYFQVLHWILRMAISTIVDRLVRERIAFYGGANASVLEAYNYLVGASDSMNGYLKERLPKNIERDAIQAQRHLNSLMVEIENLVSEARKVM
jgi:hypothetical protein